MTDAPAPIISAPAPPGRTPDPQASVPATGMPEGLDPKFWDQQSGQVNWPELNKSYGELASFKSSADERAAAIPPTPEGYKPELPAGFEIPQGVQIKFDEKDPRLVQARTLAKELGVSQEGFSKLLGLEAQRKVEEFNANVAEAAAERAKLGENGETRVKAVETFLNSALPKEDYEALRPFMWNAAAFGAIEKLIAKANSSGMPGQVPANPTPPPDTHASRLSRWYDPQQKAS